LPTASKTPVERARAGLAEMKAKIALLVNESNALDVKDQKSFERATEMRGQLKTLTKKLKDEGEKYYKPSYKVYKECLNFVNSLIFPLEKQEKEIAKKQNDYGYQELLRKRKEEEEARQKAAAIQTEIDKKQAEIDRRAKKRATEEGSDYTESAPIKVEMPVVPKTVTAKTEHGTVKVEPMLKHEIIDLSSDKIKDFIIKFCAPAYRTLADTAIKKAIEAGAIDIEGAEGIRVFETADTRHRRR
jgi:hypothetical protein